MKKIVLSLVFLMIIGIAYSQENVKEKEISFGKEVDVNKFIKKDMINIIDFYSPFCPPCMEMAPMLKKLSESRNDIFLLKVNINRKDVHGIDWKSPVAAQYDLKSIPHLWFVKKDGTILKGEDARVEVEKLIEPYRLEAIDKKIKNNPKNALLYYQRGTYFLSKSNFKNAIKDLKSCLKYVEQPHEEINFYLACAYCMNKDNKNALIQLEKALKLAKEKNNTKILNNFKDTVFFKGLENEKKFKELVKTYSK